MRYGRTATWMFALAAAMPLANKCIATERNSAPAPQADSDTADYHAELGISLDGTRVIAVAPGSPAARGGLRVGDEIRRVGTEPITSSEELRTVMAEQHPYAVVELKIDRRHQRQTIKVWNIRDTTAVHAANRPARTTEQRTAYQSNYRPADDPISTAGTREINGSQADEDYVNSGLHRARRNVDPNSDVIRRTKSGERQLDRAQRDFDRNTNRLAGKSGSPGEFDDPRTPEPPGYHVVVPGDLSGPRMNQIDRGPEQYYGRPGASQSERGDYPIPGDKGGISQDRRQATAPDALTPDRAGRTSAEDRTTRLVDEFSTHVDRQNGRPDPVTGENDSRVHVQGPLTRPAASGRPWRPDGSGGGTAFPSRQSNRGINPPNAGNDPRALRSIYGDLNRESTDRPRYDRDHD
jgi:hypothetical protein